MQAQKTNHPVDTTCKIHKLFMYTQ
jgi:hypothetical protein